MNIRAIIHESRLGTSAMRKKCFAFLRTKEIAIVVLLYSVLGCMYYPVFGQSCDVDWQIWKSSNGDFNLKPPINANLHQPDEMVFNPQTKNPNAGLPIVSFYSLYSQAEKFDGKGICFIGYLSSQVGCDSSERLVFPNLGSFELGLTQDAVQLCLNPVFNWDRRFSNGSIVEVCGVFRKGHKLRGIFFAAPVGYIENASIRLRTDLASDPSKK